MAASADLEKSSVRGLTALHGAAHGNRVEATQRLLEARCYLERCKICRMGENGCEENSYSNAAQSDNMTI